MPELFFREVSSDLRWSSLSSSHSSVSETFPMQCWPPLLGAGLLQARLRVLRPPEQEAQDDQQDQLPSTSTRTQYHSSEEYFFSLN